jgi:hypothetical protein
MNGKDNKPEDRKPEGAQPPAHSGHNINAKVDQLESDMDLLKQWMPQLFTRGPVKVPVKTWSDEPART